MDDYTLLELDRVHGGMCCGCKMAETQVQDGSIKYEAKLAEGRIYLRRGRRCHAVSYATCTDESIWILVMQELISEVLSVRE